jgi:hypothetical protein
MKNLFLIISLFIFCLVSFSQKSTKPNFDIADFNKKFEVAQWLVEYDNVAWKTTDVVIAEDEKTLAKLGAEWFCFQDKNNLWHAVYGKYADNKFDLVLHYTMDDKSKVTSSTEKIDSNFLNLHALALVTAGKQVSLKVGNKAPKFNQYIKQNADKTFSVWMLPAFQTDGTAVYGGEFIYTIDQTGSKITKDESYMQSGFRGFKTGNPREIWLNYSELEKPTLGGIFFVWYYKAYFTKIILDNKNSTSTVISFDKNTYSWVHVEKEPETKPK